MKSDDTVTKYGLEGGGEAGALMRSMDWSKTALGPVESWPQSLRTTVSTCLNSRFPILVWWGPEFVKIYNDAYRPMLGNKHPRAMGQRGRECWPEIWHIIGPMLEGVLGEGQPTWSENQFLPLERHGFAEECYFTFSYSPIRDESGGIGGVFCAVTETTRQVLGERRLGILRDMAARTAKAKLAEEACELAAEVLAEHPADLRFALIYLLDRDGKHARLAGAAGLATCPAASPRSVEVEDNGDGGVWPLAAVLRSGEAAEVDHVLILPIVLPGDVRPSGVLVAGLSPRLALDEGYRSFLRLLTGHVATAVASASAFEAEKRRAEALAEIDRAKTDFFSNVSHEFRTPLTLMLGPTEDALSSPEQALRGAALETVHRNQLRLLKLVNTLLDFSRIEAGRVQATYEPCDLPALTRDLASAFRSAIERGGLRFEVDCPPSAQPVYVDREMWEKIGLNLISNAFKFTFEGTISVVLRSLDDRVQLTVKDTGIGIPEHELPRLWERFHRIKGGRARTHEGSGIGLALVSDLVKLHGGTIDVTSQPGKGSTFTVSIPTGTAHLPAERIGSARTLPSTAVRGESYVTEALRWLPDPTPPPVSQPDAALPPSPLVGGNARVLVADDNADMRDYLFRLLRQHWTVEAVTDGEQALQAARARRPDLILTDVMMPMLDGAGLVRALRGDPLTAAIPVVMVSARAGEEARVEGRDAGADDYLEKPFSARELVARVGSQIALTRARQENARERADLLAREQAARREADRLRDAAESANQTKDAFLAMLGHELRNPLSPILTALQLMRIRGRAGNEVQIIERQVLRLARLVDDLLDVSRITRGKIELRTRRLELVSAVVMGVETARPLVEERRQQLDVQVPAEGLLVEGDADRLAQVISNLLTNAAKYSEPGTTIHVTAARAGKTVRLHVRDHGMGIAPEMLKQIFDIFVQQPQALDRSKGGLGLGLAIARSLIDLHGGTIKAHSEGLGHGSEFIVELPLVPGGEGLERVAARKLPEPAMAGRALRERPRRILVVDDNCDAAVSLAEVLVELGHQVEVAHDGRFALEVAHNFKPDVCLLDIGLPVMDGYELARRLRQSSRLPEDVRMIAVTGYGQDADRQRSQEAGFNAHVVKPVDLEVLTKVVSS